MSRTNPFVTGLVGDNFEDLTDDSGGLPNGGFQIGGSDLASQIAIMSVPVDELEPVYGILGYAASGGQTGCSIAGAICIQSILTAEYGITGYVDVPVGTMNLTLGLQTPALTSTPLNWLPEAIKSLKGFSTNNTQCLKDLKALDLTAAIIQKDASTVKMANALTNPAYMAKMPSGVDFAPDPSAPSPTIVYNSLNYWQKSFGQMLGTLVHEYGHLAKPSASDADFQNALGLSTSKDTTNISKKLGTDCFSGAKTP